VEESLQLYKQHIWRNGTTFAEAAFLLINTGEKDILVDKIAVRSQECVWTTVYYNKTQDTINSDLPYNSTLMDGGSMIIDSTVYSFNQASGDLILKSGWAMIIYIANPDTISVSDIGVTVGITIFTAQAQYYKECNVQAIA